jgi:hypothetical protein
MERRELGLSFACKAARYIDPQDSGIPILKKLMPWVAKADSGLYNVPVASKPGRVNKRYFGDEIFCVRKNR